MSKGSARTRGCSIFSAFVAVGVCLLCSSAGLLAQSVSLEWDPNSEPNLAGYNLYRSIQPGTGYVKLNTNLIPSTSYFDNTIAYGQTYYYVCTAENDAGLESGYSNEISYIAELPNTAPQAGNDLGSGFEDTPFSVSVLANDSDPDGDPLQVTGVTQGAHGSVGFTAAAVTYSPAVNYFGSDFFTYTISDGRGGSATASVSVSVTEVNDAPAPANDTRTVGEDLSVTITVLSNDSDPDGDPLSVTGVGQPAHGGAVINSGTTITYTPQANFFGSDNFTYTVSDGRGGSSTATVSVNVTGVNDPPSASADSATVVEDGSVTISVLSNDSDLDGDTLTVISVTQPAHGSATIQSGTTVRYVPAANYSGSDSFTYTISDGHGGTASAAVTVNVTAGNDPPVAGADTATLAEDSSATVAVLANDSDPEGDTLSVASVTQPAHGTATIQSGTTVRYVPASNYNGSDSFTYSVSDGHGGSATGTVAVTVNPVNDAPVGANDSSSTPEDQAVTINVLANDTDVDGDTLTLTSVTQPAHGTATITGSSIRYAPQANYVGGDSFGYTLGDGHGGTASATVSVTVTAVNDPPVAVNDSATVQEDSPVTVSVLANDSDPEGGALAVSAVTQPAHGTATIQSGTTVRYVPVANYNGSDSFTYTVSDGQGGSSTGQVSMTVSPVNDVPVAGDESVTTAEDQPITIAVLANDSDVDGDTLTVSAVGQPSHGTAVGNGNNTVTYTPAANYQGSDSFSYTISDGHGGNDSGLVQVTVTAVSEAPQANDDVATATEDSSVVVAVLANDSDPDGDLLIVSSVTQPAHGSATIQSGTTVRYVPVANYHGADSFSYTVSDGQNTDTATVLVTVSPVNDTPVAVADSASTDENTPVSIPVLANDSDVDGDSLTVSTVGQPSHGTAARNANNTVTYTPASSYRGPDSFSYSVSDGQGGVASATVTVTVSGNSPPAAVTDTASVDEDGTVNISVLANDSDPDGDSLSIASVTQPGHGSAQISGQAVVYSPAADYNGSDSFSYTVGDGRGGTAVAEVLVSVAPVNDTPVAQPDVAVVTGQQAVSIAVLANDTDVDGDTLTVVSVTNAPRGTLAIEPGGTAVNYVPKSNFNGSDSFQYTVSDGHGGSASATVSVSGAQSSNQQPLAVADQAATSEDQPVSVAVLANDSDPDGDPLSIEALTQPAHGTAQISGQSVAYTPAPNYNGTDNFSYTAADGQGGSSVASVTVTVSPVNDPPSPSGDSVSVVAGQSVLIEVLANDTDVDGDTLSLSSVGAAQQGQATREGNAVRYQAPADYLGSDSFLYFVSDGQEARQATVSVQVVESSSEPAAGLILPVTIDTGASSYTTGTYVGVGVVNSGTSSEVVSVTGIDRSGDEVLHTELVEPLPPLGQAAFLTSEVLGSSVESSTLSVRGRNGGLQGFFMVGDYRSRRMDGVGAVLEPSTTLYFPIVHENSTESTLVQLLNPSPDTPAWITVELRDAGGIFRGRAYPVIAPGGSFVGTVSEIFGSTTLSEGFIKVSSDVPVTGYEVVANNKSLSSGAGRKASSAARLVAPHFFADPDGGTTELRILNTGSMAASGEVRVYDDAGNLQAEYPVNLPSGQLTLVTAQQIFNLGNRKPSTLLTGSMELVMDAGSTPRVVAAVTFSGFAGKSATTVPLTENGYAETVFPQIAQAADSSIYTGLAIFNPGSRPVEVEVEAYDERGNLRGSRVFSLPPMARQIDLLSGEGYFGAGFERVKGHLRVNASSPVVGFAIFGDAKAEYLSTIEGQQAR